MTQKRNQDPVRMTVTPWKLSLPGKILVLCICILPFLVHTISVTLSEAEVQAYFLGEAVHTDFEQIFRELVLLGVAVVSVLWFLYERLTLRPRRTFPHSKAALAIFAFLGLYLLLGLLSTLTSAYRAQAWFGIYMQYEGYVALVSYVVVFGAAWYWLDRDETVQFARKCFTILGIVIGLLALAEHFDLHYYNNPLVQILGGLESEVGSNVAAVLTFGNPDYMGMYCAMLLPVVVGQINLHSPICQLLLSITSAVLLAAALLLTKVMSTILFGFGMTGLLLLVWVFHSNWQRIARIGVICITILAVLAGGTGFWLTRSGSSAAEKWENTFAGMEQADTFRLLSMEIEGDTLVFRNVETEFSIQMTGDALSGADINFMCDGTSITPIEMDGVYTFSESSLSHCQVQLLPEEQQLQVQLGYPTAIQANWTGDAWTVIGTGGTILSDIPQVSHSKTLQQCYTYLNGRIFIWANTISVLKSCILLGNGPATSIFYLNQNDLPALLNIFGRYVLYNKPHCWYLQIAQDTGVLSLVCILGALIVFFICGIRSCFGKRCSFSFCRTGLFFGVITYCLTAIFHDSLVYHAPMFWLLFGMGLRQMMWEDELKETSKMNG